MKTFRSRSFACFPLAAALLLLIGGSFCQAQVTIYAKFLTGTGVWAGESTAPGRTGWFELNDISFGGNNPVTIAGGGGTGKYTIGDAVFSKVVDRLTPQIFFNLASGTSLNASGPDGDVIVEFVRTTDAGPVVFFRLEYRLAHFSQSYSSAAKGDETLNESISLAAGAVRYTYWPILGKGGQGTPIVKAWSQVLNNATFNVE
jgi:type VI protein secretion system component Hcp